MPNDDHDVDTYRFCPECGAQAADRAKFCGECGRSLIKSQPQITTDVPTDGTESSTVADTAPDPSAEQQAEPQDTTDVPTVEDTSQAPAVSSVPETDPWSAPLTGPDPSAEQQAEPQEAAPFVPRIPPPIVVPTVEGPSQAPTVAPVAETDPWTAPLSGPGPVAEQQAEQQEAAPFVSQGRHHRPVRSRAHSDELDETVAQPAAPPIPYFDPPPTTNPTVYFTPWGGGPEGNGSLPSAPQHVAPLSEVLPPSEPMLDAPDEVRPDADKVSASNSERAYTSPAFVIPMVVVAAIVIIVLFISNR